ncbi:hypothetical protein [Ramlibacter sp. AN1133]|uniref:hypothetical protein n=1 Tax=Ramlibacter sp. AN1133 TaxID=3133429 RepID=UPI0030C1A3E8
MNTLPHLTAAPAVKSPAHYYFCPTYARGEPRFLLLVGASWTPRLRQHHGINDTPFFSREAYPGEPEHYANRHPWGWVFTAPGVLSYERDSKRLSSQQLQQLARLLEEQLATVPFAPEAVQGLATAAREAVRPALAA